MHKILIVGEHDGKTLNPATAKCVTCAQGIADGEIAIAVFGADTAAVAAQAQWVHVYIDRGTRRPVEIPAAIRALLQAHRSPPDAQR